MNEKKNLIVLQDLDHGHAYIHLVNDFELEKFNKMLADDEKGDERLYNNGYDVVGIFSLDRLEDFSQIKKYFR